MKAVSILGLSLVLLAGCSPQVVNKAGTAAFGPGSDAQVNQLDGVFDRAMLVAQRPLPDCTPKMEGKLSYLRSEKQFFVCEGNAWTEISMKGNDDLSGKGSGTVLLSQETFPPSEECKAGGKRLLATPDKNGNGVVDADEKAAGTSMAVCNPLSPVVKTVDLAADPGVCAAGGVKVLSGSDLNGNGVLDETDAAEKATIKASTVCSIAGKDGKDGSDGTDGKDGKDGLPLASKFIPKSEGMSMPYPCHDWGRESSPSFIVAMGPDSNRNGILDGDEEKSAQYSFVCRERSMPLSYYDLYPTDAQFVASAGAGEKPGQIDIKIAKGPENVHHTGLLITRMDGSMPPEGCYLPLSSSVRTYVVFGSMDPLPAADEVSFRDHVQPGETYSYAICVNTGVRWLQRTVKAVTARAGAVSCDQKVILTEPEFTNYNLGGFAGADAKCQLAGRATGDTGNWKAILSGRKVNAKDRVQARGTVCNSAGQVIGEGAQIFEYPLANPVTFSAQEGYSDGLRVVVTASRSDGMSWGFSESPSGPDWTDGEIPRTPEQEIVFETSYLPVRLLQSTYSGGSYGFRERPFSLMCIGGQ